MTRVTILVFAVVLASGACTGSSPAAPSVAQLGGVWNGTATLSSVSGGECVGAAIQAAVGSTIGYTVAITQTGSSMSATVTSKSSGASCSYTGTAGSNSFSFNATSCQAANAYGLQCSSGAMRDALLVADAFSGTVAGNTANGTEAETYNVVVSGTSSGVASLTLNSNFTMTR